MNGTLFLLMHIIIIFLHIKIKKKELNDVVKTRYVLVFVTLCMLIMSGFANEAKRELDYDQTKQMMIDILQTDEGKKALLEIMSDEKIKHHLIIDSDVVKGAITETLLTGEGHDLWRKLFSDPKFLKTFHQSMEEEQEKLLKSLMKDADFQQQMLDLLQNPEIEKRTLQMLKSQQFRKHLETVIIETVENRMFQGKLQDSLDKKDDEDEKKETDKDKEDNESSMDNP